MLFEEQEAFERISSQSETAGPAQRMNLAREWFAALFLVLQEYNRSHATTRDGGPLEPYPFDAIGRAAKLMEYSSTGRVHRVVSDAVGPGGRPDRLPGARRDIALALRYIAFAKAGSINDRAYIQTVANAFRVDRTTVQRTWWRDRENIWAGLNEPTPKEAVEMLGTAGARYHFNRTGERDDEC